LAKLKELFKVENPKTFFHIGSLTYKVSTLIFIFIFPIKLMRIMDLVKKGFYFYLIFGLEKI